MPITEHVACEIATEKGEMVRASERQVKRGFLARHWCSHCGNRGGLCHCRHRKLWPRAGQQLRWRQRNADGLGDAGYGRQIIRWRRRDFDGDKEPPLHTRVAGAVLQRILVHVGSSLSGKTKGWWWFEWCSARGWQAICGLGVCPGTI